MEAERYTLHSDVIPSGLDGFVEIACRSELKKTNQRLTHPCDRRRLVRYGYAYDRVDRWLGAAPIWLDEVRAMVKRATDLADTFESVTIAEYPPGSELGAHVDLDVFSPTIAILTLGGIAAFTLHDPHETVILAPRSVIVLRSAARHSVTVPKDARSRLAIVFRSRVVH